MYGLVKTGRLATTRGAELRAFLVLDHGQVLEDHPAGAVLRPLADYLQQQEADPESVVFCDAPIRRRLVDYGGGDPDGYLEATLRRMVVAAGRTLEGTPHTVLDRAALALLHTLGDRSPTWLTDYIANPKHALGAQLVDHAYERVGIELFT